MTKVLFSHRPVAGISVATSINESGEGVFAVAFRHGRLNPNHDRRTVNKILRARLDKARSNGYFFNIGQVNGDAHDLMSAFRQMFKPMIDDGTGNFVEDDNDFFGTSSSTNERLDRIVDIARQAAAQVNNSNKG
jgi:hypothetical protein